MGDDVDTDAEALVRASARLGSVLRDKYTLDAVLGVGGMATVYAATHRNGKQVALKLLHPELAQQPGILRRFLREGYVANRVTHPGSVSVIDDDVTEDGFAFLVMELLVGLTVQDLWDARQRVNPACVVAIMIPLLEVMAAAHASGIIHRDLKPANLFLTSEGEVKVLDFGIARLETTNARMTTHQGGILGTPAFMAPEQALGKSDAVDPQTDLWAIGATAFALLVGDVVHPADNTQQTLIRAATQPARVLRDLATDIPAPLADVFQRALVFDKAGRWPSASAMRDALVQAAELTYGQVPGVALLRDAVRDCRKAGLGSRGGRGDAVSLDSPASERAPHSEPVRRNDVGAATMGRGTLVMSTTEPVTRALAAERAMSPGKARISAMLIAGLLSFVVALGWGFTRRSTRPLASARRKASRTSRLRPGSSSAR